MDKCGVVCPFPGTQNIWCFSESVNKQINKIRSISYAVKRVDRRPISCPAHLSWAFRFNVPLFVLLLLSRAPKFSTSWFLYLIVLNDWVSNFVLVRVVLFLFLVHWLACRYKRLWTRILLYRLMRAPALRNSHFYSFIHEKLITTTKNDEKKNRRCPQSVFNSLWSLNAGFPGSSFVLFFAIFLLFLCSKLINNFEHN